VLIFPYLEQQNLYDFFANSKNTEGETGISRNLGKTWAGSWDTPGIWWDVLDTGQKRAFTSAPYYCPSRRSNSEGMIDGTQNALRGFGSDYVFPAVIKSIITSIFHPCVDQ
jgi:hypothetical protein